MNRLPSSVVYREEETKDLWNGVFRHLHILDDVGSRNILRGRLDSRQWKSWPSIWQRWNISTEIKLPNLEQGRIQTILTWDTKMDTQLLVPATVPSQESLRIGNLRWRRFWGDGNFNRTWRHDLCNIAHARAHHIAVVFPSATWNWSVWCCGENVSI